jgi:hypothetical protein
LIVSLAPLAMQQRMSLDQRQQQPEIAPQPYRDRRDQPGEPCRERYNDPALARLEEFLECLPPRVIDGSANVLAATERVHDCGRLCRSILHVQR